MHYFLIFFINSSIHGVTFDDYHSCVNAGNQINQGLPAGVTIPFICVQD